MSAYDPGNLFAKMIAGTVPAIKVFEDDTVLAIMDIFPQSKGHVLVIPKAASRNLLDADTASLSAAIPYVQRIARAVQTALKPDGIRIAQFNEAPAGQSVFHLHFHVIPIYEGSDLRGHGGDGRADDADLAGQAKVIAAALSA